MAGYITEDKRKVTTHRLLEMKQRQEKIAMLTAYDYTMAKIVDQAGIDGILVVHETGIPVAVFGLALRSPVGPDAEFRIAEPFGAFPSVQAFPRGIVWSASHCYILRLRRRGEHHQAANRRFQ